MIKAAQQVLQHIFGYPSFRGPQQDVIETLLKGDDALVLMPTGGGKSLCYQVPALVLDGCGVVVSPLIALMQDQVTALEQLGVKAAYLNSTLNPVQVQNIEESLLRGELDLLYVAPERLKQPRTINLLHQSKLALFAIDEAHCVSQWGHDFRSDYLQLGMLHEMFPSVPRVALTATADERTRKEIIARLGLEQSQQYIAGFDRPNIQYRITLKQNAKQQLLRFIHNEHPNDAGIVYCLSRKKVENIAAWLAEQGYTALPYHAGLSADIRATHQTRFLQEDGVIIVATVAFGMGIDKPDVRFVAHIDLPKSIEAYYQETGRAGRDGEPANAWMAYGLQDVIKLRQMLEGSEANVEHKHAERHKLDAMLGLCEITSCRRHVLLNYFGESANEKCGNCDTCLNPVDTWDGTEAAQKAISCAYRTEQRFGVNHLIDVLRGANTERIRQFNHQQVSTYDVGKELDVNQWRSVYRQLVARGYLQVDIESFGALKLTEVCRGLLRGEERIQLRRDVAEKAERKKSPANGMKSADNKLWEALRACRKELAQEQGVPPYVIFHDTTLMEMVTYLPETLEQMSRLNGVGESKLGKYGETFLGVISDTQVSNRGHGSLSDTVAQTYELLCDGKSLEDVVKLRDLASTTVHQHGAVLIKLGMLALAKIVSLSEKDVSLIKSTMLELGVDSERSPLKPVFEALAEQFEYPVLSCVRADLLLELDR